MKTILIVLSSLSFINVIAQDSVEKISQKDSVISAGPNELYLNIGPSLSMLQGAFAYNETNMTFMYKRAIKNSRLALRAGIAWKAESGVKTYYTESSVDSINRDYRYFNVTDSTRDKSFLDRGPARKIQLNIGFELRSKGRGRWNGFTGMDLVVGLRNQSVALYKIYEEKAVSGQWNPVVVKLFDYRRGDSFYCGISPKAGLTYAFNSHWALSVQAAVLATVNFGKHYSRNSADTAIEQNQASTFDFGFNGIVDELNLVYRF